MGIEEIIPEEASSKPERPRRRFRVPGLKTYAPEDPSFPYYPDLGLVPKTFPQNFKRVEKVSLWGLPDRSIVGMEAPHLGAAYTIQIFDAVDVNGRCMGRYVRIWRCPISFLEKKEERKRLQGQGLFVNLKDFAQDNQRLTRATTIFRTGMRVVFPYFYEGEGPKGRIMTSHSHHDDQFYVVKINEIVLQEGKIKP